jgi:hypothetical protein
VFVDGQRLIETVLPRAIRQEELPPRFMVGSAPAVIDEFTIYRHPLTEDEMKRILEAGRK